MSKGIAEGAITDRRKMEEKVKEKVSKVICTERQVTDRRKMKQRRGSNHGPSKKKEKVSKVICTGTSHGPSKIVKMFKNAQKWSKLTFLGVVSGPRRAQPKINPRSQ